MEPRPGQNPDDLGRGPLVMGLTWAVTILAILAVWLRLHLRTKQFHHCSSEDWIMLIALIFQVANQALVSVSYRYGLGKHDVDIDFPTDFVNVLKWNRIASVPGIIASVLARISIAILLVRLFGVHNWFRWFTIVFTTVQSIVMLATIPLVWSSAKPIEALWDVTLKDAKRWDRRITLYFQYAAQSFGTVSDVAYVLLPVIIIFRLNMTLQRKLGLALLLAGSFFTAGMSIAKTLSAGRVNTHRSEPQYDSSLAVLWSNLEQTFVIMMGCIPTLRSLTRMDFPTMSSIGSSLASLIKGERRQFSSSGTGYATSAAYEGIESNTHQLGQLGTKQTSGVSVAQGRSHESTDGLVPEDPESVLKTREFKISYS